MVKNVLGHAMTITNRGCEICETLNHLIVYMFIVYSHGLRKSLYGWVCQLVCSIPVYERVRWAVLYDIIFLFFA